MNVTILKTAKIKKINSKLRNNLNKTYGSSMLNKVKPNVEMNQSITSMTKRLANLSGINDDELRNVNTYKISYPMHSINHTIMSLK